MTSPIWRLAPTLLIAACGSTADPLTAEYPAELCPSCAVWDAPQAPFQIHGNTYYVGTRGLSAILITSDQGHVLIDGGLPSSAPQILASITALGYDTADIRLILNSHAHYDHSGGLAALQRASGATVAATEASATMIERGSGIPADPQFALLLDFPAVRGVRRVSDGMTVTVGPLALTANLTAGHAPGGTTWTWASCEGDVCLQIVYADSQTPISAEGVRFTNDSVYLDRFERGVAVLEVLPCDILLTPHPAASALWERLEQGSAVGDRDACRRYAETARQRLVQRLELER